MQKNSISHRGGNIRHVGWEYSVLWAFPGPSSFSVCSFLCYNFLSTEEVVPIKLSTKMVLIFSAMMLVGFFLFYSFASRTSLDGAAAFTEFRFRNMCISIERDLEEELEMMETTMQELTENSTFMAALNQIVRDDSEDQKMAKAAEKIAIQQLVESPLVDMYYRVTFYTRDGIFLASTANKDSLLTSRSEEAQDVISTLPWLDEADRSRDILIMPISRDYFSVNPDDEIYGITSSIRYHGNLIGYLSVVNRQQNLDKLIDYVDEPDICVEAVFDSGDLLFRNQGTDVGWTWPDNLVLGTLTTVSDSNSGASRTVYHSYIDRLNLHLYISQDAAVNEAGKASLRGAMLRRAALILIPAVILIALVSIALTHSIRKLTKKVRQVNAVSVFRQDEESARTLLTPVTHPVDRETHELEQVFDRLMLRLRDSTANELSLREGTLQAQLNALQTQINPHFIYNTLNIISAKSMESGNFEIIEICDQFAGMLRYSTDTRSRTATMADEIENVRNYLNLAKARYEENLEFVIDVPENLHTITVPKLMLQPLVENAMTHGFDGTNVLRKLSVTGQIRDEQLILEIRDNGNGFSDEMLEGLRSRIREIEAGKVSIAESGGHIGLVNTCLRLYYYSHGQMHVAIRNEDGAVITITMSCGKEQRKA